MNTQLLRAVVIAPDEELRQALDGRIVETGRVLVLKTLDRYPDLNEAGGAVRAHAAHVVFFDIASNPAAIEVAAELQRTVPGLYVVAMHHGPDSVGEGWHQVLMQLLHSGIRELLCVPFQEHLFLECVSRISRNVREVGKVPEQGEIYAFLPAKAGTGTSTIAINTALALGRQDAGKILLCDCDLNCGVVRFQLKIDHPFSIHDALEKGPRLDESVWPDLAAKAKQPGCASLDILASGNMIAHYPYPSTHAVSVLEFARRRYRRVLLDLSDHLEQFAVDMLSQCKRIYLVVQPELSTVHLAREKLRFLKSVDLDDRVEVLVTRWRKDPVLTLPDIESVLGIPITQSMSEDVKGTYKALLSGSGVEPASGFGREIHALADAISTAADKPVREATRNRKIEFFSVLPAKYSLFPSQRSSD
jgi:Flp pilus assembly CpaE family ATPase